MDLIDLPSLYPHQETFVTQLRQSMASNRRLIACANTGFGKSRIAKWIMASSARREPKEGQSGYTLFAVHRRGLVDNISQVLNQSPRLPHGVLMSGADTDHRHRIQVASIDTLLSWYCEGGTYSIDRTYDLVVYDEAHSHHSKVLKFLLAHDVKRAELGLKQTFLLGLSATPEARGLADCYSTIVQGPPATWLIENGYASPFRYFSAQHQGRLDLLTKASTGEFRAPSIEAAMQGLAGDFVGDWQSKASDRITLGFFPLRAHAQEAMQILRSHGIDARYVDGETPDDERRELFKGLNCGDYPYLCNVGVVERGTDIPAISCVQLCTCIGSRVRYLQMVGRGSRVSEGKDMCVVLDHGGNVKRHGFWEDDIQWTLDSTERQVKDQAARPTIECPQCGCIYRGGTCRSCGYEPRKKEGKSKELAFSGGELREVKKRTKPKKMPTPERLFVQCLYRCGRSGRSWRQACGLYKRELERHGMRAKVPARFQIGSTTYHAIRYDDPNGCRRVAELFPI